MSFDFGQFVETDSKKSSKPKKQKESPTTKKTPKRALKTDQKSSSMITKDDLQTLKNDLLASLKQTAGLQRHVFNRENLIQFMAEEDNAKSKLCYMEKFFRYTATAFQIDAEVKKMKKEGLIRTYKNGWMRLSQKGWDTHDQIIEEVNSP